MKDYFAALERLKTGKPHVVPKGTEITKDAVSLEAGRGKGTIKKSRAVFAKLIQAIDAAAAEQANPKKKEKEKFVRSKEAAVKYRDRLEAGLAREVSLLKELFEVKQRLARLTGENVLPIRGRSAPEGDEPIA